MIQLIEEESQGVLLRVDRELYERILQTFGYQIIPVNQTISHDFLRRVVPFFMNQFLLWTKENVDDNMINVSRALQKLKSSKSSKQQKFELGDLKLIYSQRLNKSRIYQQIRSAWEQFLYSNDIINRIDNNKRIKDDSKSKYLDAIELLKAELQKSFPHSRFLSKFRIPSNQQDSEVETQEFSSFNHK